MSRWFAITGVAAAALAVPALASAQSIVVKAKGSLSAGVGPIMQLRINEVPVNSVQVLSTAYTDYTFATGMVPAGAKVEIVYENDICCTGGDRNLYIQSIQVNGATIAATDPRVQIEWGTGPTAMDGLEIRAGQSEMYWNGIMRLYAPGIYTGPTYYFSDCQTDAATGCLPGNNANAGTTPEAPKRDLSGFNVNTLPAGTRLLFKRGGSWNHSTIRLDNRNTNAASPLTFDAYGTGNAPIFRTVTNYAFEFGGWQNTVDDRGYVFRNIKFDGVGTGQWGFWFRGLLRDVLLENVEITRFYTALEFQGGDALSFITVRNSKIVNNRGMGMIGTAHDSRFEGNLFEGNGTGSALVHAVYLSTGNRNVFRNNRFVRNSVVDGVCTGGNFTAHGQINGLTIEGNTVLQDASADGCYGINLAPGHPNETEGFQNVVIRNNSVINLGGAGIAVQAAPGALIEGNRIIQDQARFHYGISANQTELAEDIPGGGEIIRNNIGCYGPNSTSSSTFITVSTSGTTVTGNVVRTGADSTTGVCAR